ncbi:hypothetical protein [Burkholderia oklahomensis]|nr:hypothetical protein [Burkholderia oklahomensis]QPS41400.1 hypothetical protein I6G57_24645 [Burkholderia oklahomensis]
MDDETLEEVVLGKGRRQTTPDPHGVTYRAISDLDADAFIARGHSSHAA